MTHQDSHNRRPDEYEIELAQRKLIDLLETVITQMETATNYWGSILGETNASEFLSKTIPPLEAALKFMKRWG